MFEKTTWWRGVATACLICGITLAQPAWADEPDTTEEPDEDDNTVTTVAPDERSVEDSRLPSGFVTRLRLGEEGRKGRDLGDALGRVPGIYVRRSSSMGRAAYATVRGGNSRQLAVSLNGMRLSAPVGVGFDVGSLSLAGIDNVDVYRGGAATVHGGGALTGALDLHTGLPREEGWHASATSLGGSYDTYGLSAKTALVGDGYAVGVDAGFRQSEGDFAFVDAQGTGHERVNNDHRQMSVLANGRVELSEHVLEPLLMYEAGSAGAPGPSEFQEQFADARLDTDRLVSQLGWERRDVASGGWGVVDADARLGYQHRGVDYDNPNAYPGTSEVRDTSTLEAIEATAQAHAWLDFGDLIHMGLEGRREAYDATNRIAYEATADTSEIAAERHTIAAALSNELLLAETAVSLIGALRFEYIDDTSRSWTPLIPAAGAIWRARKWLEFRGNVARTFRAPDFDELYLNMVGVRGDPELEPERALTWDAGVRLGREEGLVSLEAAIFRNDFEETIEFIARTAYLFEAANLGSGTSQGVEATLGLRPHRRVDVMANYTFTDASLDGMAAGATMPGQPVHRSAAGAEVELGGLGFLSGVRSLRFFGEAHWRSRIYLDSFANLSNPPFWTADLGAAYAPSDWLEVTVNARNLADNRRGADTLQRPLPGRAFYVGVTVER